VEGVREGMPRVLVCVALGVRERVTVPEGEAAAEGVTDGVRDTLPLQEALPDRLGVADGVPLPVCVASGVPLVLGVAERVTLAQGSATLRLPPPASAASVAFTQ